MLKIGSLKLKSHVLCAPLAGISDSSYRLLCRHFGASFTFLEMINARAISHNSKKTKKMLATDAKDKPIGIQLVGAELNDLLRALDVIQHHDFDLLDFNAACPVRKVCRRGEGAALMKEPEKLENILRGITQRWPKPVTIKIRSGWDPASKNAVTIARIAENSGVKAIFIHGRDRNQFYKGTVDYKIIADVKKNVSIPVIASGDIWSANYAKKMFEETGCDGILVARGGLGHPWIFKEIDSFLKHAPLSPAPTIREIIDTILMHLDFLVTEHGEKNAVPIMRKFIGWYLKGKPFVRMVRQRVNGLTTKKDLLDLMDYVLLLAKQ